MLGAIVALALPVTHVLRPKPIVLVRSPSHLTVGRPPVARTAHGVLAIRPGPLIIVLPAAIAARFMLDQRGRHTVLPDVAPGAAVVASVVPAPVALRPVVTIREKDLLVEVLDDANSGLNDDQGREDCWEAHREPELHSVGERRGSTRESQDADDHHHQFAHERVPFWTGHTHTPYQGRGSPAVAMSLLAWVPWSSGSVRRTFEAEGDRGCGGCGGRSQSCTATRQHTESEQGRARTGRQYLAGGPRRHAVALVAGCATTTASSGSSRASSTVSDSDFARLAASEVGPTDEARSDLALARDELGRDKLSLVNDRHEGALARSDQGAASADMSRAAAESDIGKDSNEPAQMQQARDDTEVARQDKEVADARLAYSKKLATAQAAQVTASERKVDLMSEKLNLAKLQSLEEAAVPAAGKYDRSALMERVVVAQRAYDRATAIATTASRESTTARQLWQDLAQRL
jgi:hypothetical protein